MEEAPAQEIDPHLAGLAENRVQRREVPLVWLNPPTAWKQVEDRKIDAVGKMFPDPANPDAVIFALHPSEKNAKRIEYSFPRQRIEPEMLRRCELGWPLHLQSEMTSSGLVVQVQEALDRSALPKSEQNAMKEGLYLPKRELMHRPLPELGPLLDSVKNPETNTDDLVRASSQLKRGIAHPLSVDQASRVIDGLWAAVKHQNTSEEICETARHGFHRILNQVGTEKPLYTALAYGAWEIADQGIREKDLPHEEHRKKVVADMLFEMNLQEHIGEAALTNIAVGMGTFLRWGTPDAATFQKSGERFSQIIEHGQTVDQTLVATAKSLGVLARTLPDRDFKGIHKAIDLVGKMLDDGKKDREGPLTGSVLANAAETCVNVLRRSDMKDQGKPEVESIRQHIGNQLDRIDAHEHLRSARNDTAKENLEFSKSRCQAISYGGSSLERYLKQRHEIERARSIVHFGKELLNKPPQEHARSSRESCR